MLTTLSNTILKDMTMSHKTDHNVLNSLRQFTVYHTQGRFHLLFMANYKLKME